MAKTEKRFFKNVEANTSETDEFIPPTGTFFISQLGGNGGANTDTVVAIIWDYGGDDEVLFCTHGDSNQLVNIELTGDASKKLVIKLINDQGSDDFLGGFWTGSD